jgi:ParB family chromosome partitioning protein
MALARACRRGVARADDAVHGGRHRARLPDGARPGRGPPATGTGLGGFAILEPAPEQLRHLLNQGEVDANRDPLVKFVTLKAYEKAGGHVRRDLFSDDAKVGFLQDVVLLERLAREKLQKRAAALLKEGWKWVDVRARYDREEFVRHGELRQGRREPDAEHADELAAIASRLEALDTQMSLSEADGDDEA